MCDDLELMVRDFRDDSIDPPRRRNVSYLRYDLPHVDEAPLRVHPIEALQALSTQSTDAMDAWARHAAAANGFGDTPIGEAPARRPVSYEVWHEARANRARMLGEAMAAAVWVATWLVASWWRSWRRKRAHAATYESLASLDDRTLRDLGFDRSEVGSVAAEVHRQARRTRVRSRPALGHVGLV